MATKIPKAVATRASEMAGATTERSAEPMFPIAVNALMIPTTVPKTPRKGAIFDNLKLCFYKMRFYLLFVDNFLEGYEAFDW